MPTHDAINKAYSDACYDAWREGRNPDNVDRDQFADAAYDKGIDQATWRDAYPNRGRPEEPQEEERKDVEAKSE
jgi:hypothetical protein